MKESVGYTVTLNIVIVFIVIVFAFLSATLLYFKANKVSNVITNSIEKYEGYNSLSQKEILTKLSSLGYNMGKVSCKSYVKKAILSNGSTGCYLVNDESAKGKNGYCVYYCSEIVDSEKYYYYKVSTNMFMNVPIINDMINIPIFSNTNRLYDFESNLNK